MTLPICFIVDSNVYMYLDIICKSITKYLTIPFHICVLTDSETTVKLTNTLLSSIYEDTKFTIKNLSSSDITFLNNLYVSESRTDITGFGYAQLFICDYFSEFKKLLFLEPDQIVRKDLAPFWEEINTKDIKLAAVDYKNGSITLNTLHKLYSIGKVHSICAFNCGVVVYDTEYWKDKQLKNLCFNAVRMQKETNGNYYNYYAEGAMNIALQDHFIDLHKKYNLCDLGWNENIQRSYIDSGIILHWNGLRKPWKPDGLYKEYYKI